MAGAPRGLTYPLSAACAWALLVAGWIGIGSFAVQTTASPVAGFAFVAAWLLAVGAAAAAPIAAFSRSREGEWGRVVALCVGAALTCVALLAIPRGGGAPALVFALFGWATLTALASRIAHGLRHAPPMSPGPPITAATAGAIGAGVALGDVGNLPALSQRLAMLFAALAMALALLPQRGETRARRGCRAGLFDCPLAWPPGVWRDPLHWPTRLAGLAMLPMMAALPLVAERCRPLGVPPWAAVLLQLAAMFVPALLLRNAVARWSARTLSTVCAALLVSGAAIGSFAAAPTDMLGLAVLHGAAWGLAGSGQLQAPTRHGRQDQSPLRAAAACAVLTVAFGVVVGWAGIAGVAYAHATLGVVAAFGWVAGTLAHRHADIAAHAPRVPPT